MSPSCSPAPAGAQPRNLASTVDVALHPNLRRRSGPPGCASDGKSNCYDLRTSLLCLPMRRDKETVPHAKSLHAAIGNRKQAKTFPRPPEPVLQLTTKLFFAASPRAFPSKLPKEERIKGQLETQYSGSMCMSASAAARQQHWKSQKPTKLVHTNPTFPPSIIADLLFTRADVKLCLLLTSESPR
ncbi:unnamed protein product [Cercospora beticola]|nr:unnamed protein product [Cercospora beticola]